MPPQPRPLPPIPDLLSAAPMVRVDFAALRQTLVFAFAMGGTREAFDTAKIAIAARERREHVDASNPQAYFGARMEAKLAKVNPAEP